MSFIEIFVWTNKLTCTRADQSSAFLLRFVFNCLAYKFIFLSVFSICVASVSHPQSTHTHTSLSCFILASSIQSNLYKCVHAARSCFFMPFVQFILTVIRIMVMATAHTTYMNIYSSLPRWNGPGWGPPAQQRSHGTWNRFSIVFLSFAASMYICTMIKMWYLFFRGFVRWFVILWNGNFLALYAQAYICDYVCVSDVCLNQLTGWAFILGKKSFEFIVLFLPRLFNICVCVWTCFLAAFEL